MPQSTLENLMQSIARGKALPAILLLGTDPYLRDCCRRALIEKFIPEAAREWAVTKISAAAGGWEEMLERAQTVPMLSPHQIVFLEGMEALERLGEESSEEIDEAIATYLKDPAPFSIVVFEAETLDGRRWVSKLLTANAVVVELSTGRQNMAMFASEMAGELGADIDPAALAELVEAVNAEPAKIRLELQKLSLYAAGRKITVADIEALVVSARKYTVWRLAEVLAAHDRIAAMEFFDCLLREGEQPAGIVGALAWMYRKLVEARELPPGTNQFQAARDLGMRSESAGIAIAQARKFSREQLLDGIVALAEADSALKSGGPNPRATMEFLIARLTTAARPARATA
ncbi:MAG TPA: DNA polymerase III subunit delta [Candidatus Acidoferrales bacterium]|nr:DNA polymerase III subunit delta [Candidatus Acidoferrales bacterium]